MAVGSVYRITNFFNVLPNRSANDVRPLSNLLTSSPSASRLSRLISQNTTSSVASAVSSVQADLKVLKTQASRLSAAGTASPLNARQVSASAEGVTGTAANGAEIADYTLNVEQLATAQVNTSSALKSSAAAATGAGDFAIGITSGGNTRQVRFSVDAADTNGTALNKIAAAINKSGTAVTASVVTNTQDGTSQLKLTGKHTGADNAFQVSDLKGSAVPVMKLGLETINAKDAMFTLNGQKKTSAENTVTLEKGKAQVDFTRADGKDITVSVGKSANAAVAGFEQFAQAYNKLRTDSLNGESSLAGLAGIGDKMESILRKNVDTLASAGVTLRDDGTLKVDSKKMESAFRQTPSVMENMLSGQKSLTQQIKNEISGVSSDATHLIKKQMPTPFYNQGGGKTAGQIPNGLLFDVQL